MQYLPKWIAYIIKELNTLLSSEIISLKRLQHISKAVQLILSTWQNLVWY